MDNTTQQQALSFVSERPRMNDERDEWAEGEEGLTLEDQMLLLDDPAHKSALLSRLDTFRRNRAFCDVVLFVDGHELLAHKAVLAAISPPLFDLFLSNSGSIPIDEDNDRTLLPDQALELAQAASQVAATTSTDGSQRAATERQQTSFQNGSSSSSTASADDGDRKTTSQMAYFEFPEIDSESMEALVEFAYTGRLRIGGRRVKELYRTAFAFKVTPVARACANWLAEHLTVNNCIDIRRLASNLNKDPPLLNRVDTFIRDNFEAVISESTEFAQLPCIKTRIIVAASDAEGDQPSQLKAPPLQPSGDELAMRCLRYFQLSAHRAAGERVNTHIETLTGKTHLLVENAEETQQQTSSRSNAASTATTTNGNGIAGGRLQDANELDEKSSLGSCELVKDYKRSASMAPSGKKSISSSKAEQQVALHVLGATPIKLNSAGTGRLTRTTHNQQEDNGNKFASIESLCSVDSCHSNGSVPSEGIADSGDLAARRNIICVLPTAPGFWVCLALLFHRLVRISIRLSEDEELIRSNRTSSIASSTDGAGAESYSLTLSLSAEDASDLNNDQQNRYLRSMLPPLGEARCAIGAAFLDGKIMISGGFDRNVCLCSAEELDIMGGATDWRLLAPMCGERARFDAAVVDGKVYAVGGSNGNNDLSSCECFNPATGQWTEVRPLEPPRSHNGCASLNGLLYCIGGSTDQTILPNCACYSPKTDEWSETAPLNVPRSQAGCTSWRGLVLCVGGSDGWNCLDTVEAYDPKKDQWCHLARLLTPRRGCAVAVLGDSLWAIGGHDGHNALTSVEVLYSPNAQWRPGPSMQQSARVHHHAVSAPNFGIFVIGGFNGTQFLASMEVLESEESGWHSWIKKQNTDSTILLNSGPDRNADDEPGTANTTPTPRG